MGRTKVYYGPHVAREPQVWHCCLSVFGGWTNIVTYNNNNNIVNTQSFYCSKYWCCVLVLHVGPRTACIQTHNLSNHIRLQMLTNQRWRTLLPLHWWWGQIIWQDKNWRHAGMKKKQQEDSLRKSPCDSFSFFFFLFWILGWTEERERKRD